MRLVKTSNRITISSMRRKRGNQGLVPAIVLRNPIAQGVTSADATLAHTIKLIRTFHELAKPGP